MLNLLCVSLEVWRPELSGSRPWHLETKSGRCTAVHERPDPLVKPI
jgi:hypothetical protein